MVASNLYERESYGSCEIEYQTRRFKDGLFYEGYYCEDCGHEGVFTSKFLSNE